MYKCSDSFVFVKIKNTSQQKLALSDRKPLLEFLPKKNSESVTTMWTRTIESNIYLIFLGIKVLIDTASNDTVFTLQMRFSVPVTSSY